jgi:hypothetical protein
MPKHLETEASKTRGTQGHEEAWFSTHAPLTHIQMPLGDEFDSPSKVHILHVMLDVSEKQDCCSTLPVHSLWASWLPMALSWFDLLHV